MAIPADRRTVYLDRYTVAGDGTMNLAALMIPPDFLASYPPSGCAITAGNSAGHFSLSGNNLDVSATGDSADLSAGTYTLTIQFTWSALGSGTASATLTIIAPGLSVYVDPDTGADSNAGTKASPWQHAPDDPNATSTSLAARTPGSLTLCVHKGGKRIYSKLVQHSANLINASNCGWGSGATIYCGADAMGAGATPSSAEVSNNPLYASMKKWTYGAALSPAQNIIDRGANGGDGALALWAQYPAAGADPFTDSYDPSRNLTGGMAPIAASAVTSAGAASTFALDAAAIAEFGSADLTGCLLGLWSGGNFVNWFVITAYNTSTHVATFNFTTTLQTTTGVPTTGNTSFQIVGHPLSIKAAGQFAWSIDNKTRYALLADGTAAELMTRDNGLTLDAVAAGAVHGLQFEGYWGTTDFTGCGVVMNKNSAWGFEVLGCTMRWLSSFGGVGAAIRGAGGGTATDVLVQWNTAYDTVRSSGARFGSTNNLRVVIESNTFSRLQATVAYIGAADTCDVDNNTIKDCTGVHANGITLYLVSGISPVDCRIRNNDCINSDRGFTLNPLVDLVVSDNLFEMGTQKDACRVYGSDVSAAFTGNIYVRRRGVVGVGEDALAAGSPGNYGTHSGNIIDGLTGGVDATFTGNMITQHSYGENDVTLNVAPDSGNTYEPRLWDGTLSPRWKQFMGSKRVGRSRYVYGIAVVSFTSVINQDVSTVVASGWSLLSSDGTRPISITNGEYNIANDASGTGAVGWSSSSSTVANGKYINVRVTTTSTYETDKTATLDLGDGNVFTWTARTKQAAGYPLVVVDTGDNWKPTNLQIAAAGTKTLTFAFFGRIDAGTAFNTIFGHYAGGTSERFKVECLGSGNGYRLRIKLQNSTPSIIAEFQTPSLASYIGQLISLMITVDLAQSTSAAGVKVYVNGASAGSLFSTVTWTQNGIIDWTYTSSQFAFGNLNFAGLVGMVYLNTTWVDVTDAAVRDKFTPLRIGVDGSNATGAQPPIFLIGTDATSGNNWMDAAGINRGTGAKFIKQGATAVTLDSGGAPAWPSYTYATALTSLAGSATPNVGQARTYTGTLNGALLNPITIALSDGASGIFTPSSINLDPTTGPQDFSFTYEPASAGAKTITASSSGLTSATLGVTAQPAVATSYTLTGATSANVGDTVTLTVTLNGSNPSGSSFSLSLSGVSGTFSDNPMVVSAGTQIGTVDFTPTSAGTAIITPTNTEGLTDPAAKSITVAAAAGGGAVSPTRLRLGVSVGL